MVACYPSPAGATESLLELETWEEIRARAPGPSRPAAGRSGAAGQPGAARARLATACFLVPIDQCFRLVGIIRMHWKGFTGGTAVWEEIDRFFADLRRMARPARQGLRA